MLKEQLLLAEVTETVGESIVFDFIDETEGQLYEIKWNFKRYDADTKQWYDSEEQVEKLEEWAEEYFDMPLNELKNLSGQGVRKDIYHYNRFNSFWEVKQIEKMPIERKGEILDVEILEISEDTTGIHIYFEEDGKRYSVRFRTAKYIESLKQWYEDPIEKERALNRFENTFGVPFEDREVLIGENMMVAIKVAFGRYSYLEASTFPEARKEEMKKKALAL